VILLSKISYCLMYRCTEGHSTDVVLLSDMDLFLVQGVEVTLSIDLGQGY
jgi:hypothetical protein